MDICEVNKLILFSVFVIPSFLNMNIYSILQPNVRLDTTKFFIDIISYSYINYGICFYLFILFKTVGYIIII